MGKLSGKPVTPLYISKELHGLSHRVHLFGSGDLVRIGDIEVIDAAFERSRDDLLGNFGVVVGEDLGRAFIVGKMKKLNVFSYFVEVVNL